MKVLLEFSRGTLDNNHEAVELIRNLIIKEGHELTNDLLKDSKDTKEFLPEGMQNRLQKAIAEAQCVIIEGSVVSLSLGYVLTEAINLGKPVLFLTRNNSMTQRNRFVTSIASKLLTYNTYSTDAELVGIIHNFLENDLNIKTRFNLVLPNHLNSYITIQSLKQGISKTEYIIKLIEKAQSSNE